MPFTLDDLLNLHPHEVVNLVNSYREALEKTSCKCRWSYDHAASVLIKCPRCLALNK